MESFSSHVDLETGLLKPYDNKVTRRLSDMKGMFADNKAYEKALSREDSLVYEVFERAVPEEEGHLAHAVTVVYPGKVANEYYMTKGHFHTKENTAEIYLCLRGSGAIMMATKEGKVSYLEMEPGSLVYVAPYWAHRTVNTSDDKFVFLAIYPADAGHNYGTIEETGFPKLVVEADGKPSLVDNPRYRL